MGPVCERGDVCSVCAHCPWVSTGSWWTREVWKFSETHPKWTEVSEAVSE